LSLELVVVAAASEAAASPDAAEAAEEASLPQPANMQAIIATASTIASSLFDVFMVFYLLT
jgi:hypothetical protein